MGSILLVEPDPETSEWARDLADAGHALLVARTQREAPEFLRDGGIDVVVIDSYAQCVGVVELAKKIDALPDAPPVILVSASPVAPEVSVRIGAAAFLPKPFEGAELVAIVTRLVGEHRPGLAFEDEPTNLLV